MSNTMKVEPFKQIDLNESFFDSLKADYPGFERWFQKKADGGDDAYVARDDAGNVEGFLYLKTETGIVDDVTPPLPPANRIKIGTFKIDAHGTKLGERFLKKVFDRAIAQGVDEIYVTVFAKHTGLTKLFDRYGFNQIAKKPAANGDAELVMVRSMQTLVGDAIKDYPFIHAEGNSKFLLAIHPIWHTQLLPDSILKNETFDIVQDLSHTNSIRKVYVCQMPIEEMQPGDIVVMYRTKDPNDPGTAEYRSVATSIGVIEDVKRATDFPSEDAFIQYCEPYSVFSRSELKQYYANKYKTRVIKFTYNAAMAKRLIRKTLIEDIGLERDQRWGFFRLTDDQFAAIVQFGGVSESLIIN